MTELTFKVASEDWEFEAIHRLNYKTFVEEIPQHEQNSDHRLVDKFHHQNTYVVAVRNGELLAMACVRGSRPFSLDQKLVDLDSYLPPDRAICEVRLLAVENHVRRSKVTVGLLGVLAQTAIYLGYDCAIISGTVRQLKLYRHLGFLPFGPRVGSGDAMFQPMYLTLESFDVNSAQLLSKRRANAEDNTPANFLPGPVAVAPEVHQAFQSRPSSHRSGQVASHLQVVKRRLCELTGAGQVEILLGSGTLANDVIAAQLSLEKQPGLILANGEFGERLVDHARRHRLSFDTLRLEWGRSFNLAGLNEFLDRHADAGWLWAVHCETSTGTLNDLSVLNRLAATRGVRICLDCVSSIGVVPVDLRSVYLASGVSGKGLASYSGLSMVFYHQAVQPAPRELPRYLDLGLYAASGGIPFTQSSNLVYALKAAIECCNRPRRFREIASTASWLRQKLRQSGYRIVVGDDHASPAVTTLALPSTVSSRNVGWQMEKAGWLLNYRSEYLMRRNWLQICLMGEYAREDLSELISRMDDLCAARRVASAPLVPPHARADENSNALLA